MKAVILAGGFGTRLSEETDFRPKPMIEIGGKPILWHIMKIYSAYGINDFIICLGYKGHIIKEYFVNYYLHHCDFEMDIKNNRMEMLTNSLEPWRVTLIDTGYETQIGGRIKRIENYIDDTFMVTYGDGLADINLHDLLSFHKKHGKIATITSVQPPSRFGILRMDEECRVINFLEKPTGNFSTINAGFFVFEPEIFHYISDDTHTVLEKEPFENLARDGQMFAYPHHGFWTCMDTLRDKKELEAQWQSQPKWKVWD